MSQGNLNKFVTRIKRLILIVFRLTIKYDLFSKGEERLLSDPALRSALVVHEGKVCHERLAAAQEVEYSPLEELS